MAWGLLKADQITLEAIEGEGNDFDPEPLESQELDLLLVGNYEGPATQLFYAAEEQLDGSSIVSESAVEACAAWLTRIPSDHFAPQEVFTAQSMHSSMLGNEQRDYLSAIDTVKHFRNFIESANKQGCKLRLWVAG